MMILWFSKHIFHGSSVLAGGNDRICFCVQFFHVRSVHHNWWTSFHIDNDCNSFCDLLLHVYWGRHRCQKSFHIHHSYKSHSNVQWKRRLHNSGTVRDKFYPLVAISLGPPHNRPTKRPVTRRNPLLVVVLILFPRRVAIPLAGAGWRWHNGWQGDVALLIGTNFTAVWQFHLPGVGTKEWQEGGISSHKLVQRRQSTCYRKNSRLYRIYKEMWVNPTVSNIFSHNMITYPIVRAASLSHAFKISFCVWPHEEVRIGFDAKVKKLGISDQLDELKRVGWIEGPSRELFYWAASCDELCVLPASPLTLLGCYTYGR